MSAKLFAKKYLTNVKWPTKKVSEKELWDVSGILKDRLNENLKFDVRPLKKIKDGRVAKKGSTTTTANKMVVETLSQWIIVDIQELHNYIMNHRIREINLEDIIKNLDWNIIIEK